MQRVGNQFRIGPKPHGYEVLPGVGPRSLTTDPVYFPGQLADSLEYSPNEKRHARSGERKPSPGQGGLV